MKCPKCKAEVKNDAKFCPSCGARLASPTPEPADVDIDSLMAGLDDDLADLDAEVGEMISDAESVADTMKSKKHRAPSARPAPSAPSKGAPRPAQPVPPRPHPTAPKEERPGPPLARHNVHEYEAMGFLLPMPQRIDQAWEYVRGSEYIRMGQLYDAMMENVHFAFDPDDHTVNAYATHGEARLSDGPTIDAPCIVYLSGIATAHRIAAAALAMHDSGRAPAPSDDYSSFVHEAVSLLGRKICAGGGQLSPEAWTDVLDPDLVRSLLQNEEGSRITSRAHSYATSMDMATIAHEAGHICLGHTLGVAMNYDIARNQERQADSFASSVLSSSPFRDYLVLGEAMTWLVDAWVEHANGRYTVTTHPFAMERLQNAVRGNSEAARDIGLLERIADWLPPPAESGAANAETGG